MSTADYWRGAWDMATNLGLVEVVALAHMANRERLAALDGGAGRQAEGHDQLVAAKRKAREELHAWRMREFPPDVLEALGLPEGRVVA